MESLKEQKFKDYKSLEGGIVFIPTFMQRHLKDAYAFSVYFYLCRRYDVKEGFSSPSVREIADNCYISEKTTRKAIKYLEGIGFIKKDKYIVGNVVCNKYYIYYIDKDINDEKETVHYVYVHKNKLSNEVLYVGKGVDGRYSDLSTRNGDYLEYIREVGNENISKEIIYSFNNPIDAFNKEKEVTDMYKEKGEARFNKISGYSNMYI